VALFSTLQVLQILLSNMKTKRIIFFSDRFRTTINIIGDALGASIISHFCKKKKLEEDEIYPLEGTICDTC